MRHEKAAAILNLARTLASSAEGLTLDEMAQELGENRRTIERMRDALASVFPQLEEHQDGATKRFRIPGGLDGFINAPTKEELLELNKAIEGLRRRDANASADALQALEKKIRSAIKRPALNKLAPDLEVLLRAEMIAVPAGPRAVEDPDVLLAIRDALLQMKVLQFVYHGGSRPGAAREVVPFGILFGRCNYLIAADLGTIKPKHWRLDKIECITVLEKTASRPAGFNLVQFATGSFGFFQGEQEDVVLHVLPHGMDEFKNWQFHPNQKVEFLSDGGALVRFRASGMLELAWHLFCWGNQIEIVSPVSLRQLMTTELRVALSRHEEPPRLSSTVPSSGAVE
ncbi:WYL domain-containing protein [Bradyrhizobium sp. CB1717]|uniref:helix-turn-helix transcriptional regulator n=1 Tax=Bradyrhizobium sp. CB1717 TaxID=3039154 RepID=UPI0024B15868|nr:WYL domain-containing protein [Bradyrhizobium sp. CB1717]WFU25131.1 WYL domain-containing protein [Bradyrhizobium sp. CB1717]